MNCLAIVTARGGSKRIPRKNIRSFLGRPIIAYSIAAALESGCFSRVMVSTDDAEIAQVARELGAEVPFLRSAATSDDFATTAEVLLEVLAEYARRGEEFDCACCLYPTAPFVTAERLREAHRLLLTSGADAAVPVVRFSFPIERALEIRDGRLAFRHPEFRNSRSQDLTPAFHDSGQFYFFRVPPFLASRSLFGEQTVALELPETEVQDIDTEEDWQLAELKYRLLRGGDR
ncbi:pseudaminic acid cytidylyltransferase [Geomonas limicola]|uniref:Pseudaminic acid cytidylyltransferase n=1 Tax=Geomonas limicola TaxID=2740186 RepID=A0A6V8N7H2_9BACT|nr:pseudaminic acid cytidylyltransferase [Geomonas limicola]GFO68508.1 pseudaminic acid cytidylyltransferase [Geomonas limicola]